MKGYRMVTGYKTAMKRKEAPAPLQLLQEKGLLKGRCLDYGCGKGPWLDMDGFDPHWKPERPKGLYDTITCIYVLNVVDNTTENNIVVDIFDHLKPGGIAYFAVRRDIPKEGKPGRDCVQRYVEYQNGLVIEKKGGYAIYSIHRVI